MSPLWSRLALATVLVFGAASPLAAMGSDPPPEDDAATACKSADKSKCPDAADKAKKAKEACKSADKSKCPKQSFRQLYLDAVAMIDAKKYDAALEAMRALDDGTSADVITQIGFINRKMGQMAEAQMYYEAALHMQPNH